MSNRVWNGSTGVILHTIVTLVALICVTVLMITHAVDSTAGVGLFAGLSGTSLSGALVTKATTHTNKTG